MVPKHTLSSHPARSTFNGHRQITSYFLQFPLFSHVSSCRSTYRETFAWPCFSVFLFLVFGNIYCIPRKPTAWLFLAGCFRGVQRTSGSYSIDVRALQFSRTVGFTHHGTLPSPSSLKPFYPYPSLSLSLTLFNVELKKYTFPAAQRIKVYRCIIWFCMGANQSSGIGARSCW